MIGLTLGHYRIESKLGKGGMGEVYRATDLSLRREVALKMLPRDVAADPDRVARFRREAHTLASLNHPHIGAIYGLHEAEGTAFLVLELVEGEDLTARLQRGPLPVDDALDVARQIAEALEAAHERGIVHRDLKPANIKVTPSGIAKVLDFGLAKAYARDPQDLATQAGQYTTLTVEGTAAGVIVGTPAYMAPEQVRGQAVDKRADVWAFGVVLFEMLTGRRLFGGTTLTDVLAAVVTSDPDWSRLPEKTPSAVRRLLRRCLQRDPRRRLPDVGAARLELTEALAGETEPETLRPEGSPASPVRRAVPWLVTVLALAAAATVAIVAIAERWPSGDLPQRPPLRLTIDTPPSLRPASRNAPVISPDGRHVVVVGRDQLLYLRRMDALAFQPLAGTQGASSAFWSPDSRHIGFTAGTQVKVVTLEGDVQTLCTLDGVGWSGAWGSQSLAVSKGPNTHNDDGATIVTVSPSSGEWAPLTALDTTRGELAHGVPEFLPDGRAVAFAVVNKDPAHSGAYVARLEAPGSHRPLPLRTTGAVRFADGYALVNRDSNILAYRFDSDRLETTGEPILLAADLATVRAESFGGFFSVSRQGLMVYLSAIADEVQLAWVKRDGSPLAHVGRPERCDQFALSPDETRVALQVRGLEGGDSIWILDLARGVPVRVATGAVDPVWSPDGTELVFTSASASSQAERIGSRSPSRLFRKSARHDAPAVPVLPPDVHGAAQMWAKHWTRHGPTLLYLVQDEGRNRGFSMRPGDTSAPVPLDLTEAVVDEMQLSPDGRQLAYLAMDQGESEVHLRRYPGPGERIRVSPDGGGQPKWRADGRELYYVTPRGALMAVAIGLRGELGSEHPQRLFDIAEPVMWLDQYAPSRDGQRFLVRLPVETGASALRLVSDWQPVEGRQR